MATATLVVGCYRAGPSADDDSAGRLRFANGKNEGVPPFGFGQGHVAADQPLAMVTYTLCADGGPVRITGIKLKDATNLTVVDWGLRDYPPTGVDVGAWRGNVLADESFSQDPVPGPCRHPKKLSELGISAKRNGPGIGIAHGFQIETSTGNLSVPMRIMLCPRACPDASNTSLP